LATAAQLKTDVTHEIQPTPKPMKDPKASLAYTYDPPFWRNMLPSSAKHRATQTSSSPHTAKAQDRGRAYLFRQQTRKNENARADNGVDADAERVEDRNPARAGR